MFNVNKNVLSLLESWVMQVCLRIKLMATRNGYRYLNKMISWPWHIIMIPLVNVMATTKLIELNMSPPGHRTEDSL